MKKRFLLAILPALMALSSCTFMESATAVKNNGFLEDCLAHEEIFGEEKLENRALQPRRVLDTDLDPELDPEEVTTPYIGVQSVVAGGKVSFRFVAAVRFESAASRIDTNATWHRSVTSPTGSFVKEEGEDAVPACTTAYLALSNGGTPYSISDFNRDHGNTTYTHFVVYTIRNISLSTYAGHYVSAYLSFSKNGENGIDPVSSKAIAINVERTEKHVYSASDGYCYLDGTFSGTPRKVEATRVRNGSNKAEFEYIDFAVGDVFTINEFWNTKFFIHGSTECLNYDGNEKIISCFEDDGTSAKKIRVKENMNGSYGLYLNVVDNKLYTEGSAPYDKPTGFFVKGTMNDWSENSAHELFSTRSTDIGVSHKITLSKGDQFKVYKDWGGGYTNWYGWRDALSGAGSFKCSDGSDNIEYTGDDPADFYIMINSEYAVWIGTSRVY